MAEIKTVFIFLPQGKNISLFAHSTDFANLKVEISIVTGKKKNTHSFIIFYIFKVFK